MLENDFVGQRSGTRPLLGFAVSQKKRNVRCSTSSMVEGWTTARRRGASADDWQDAPRRMRSAANAADVRRTYDQKFSFRPTCSRRPRLTTQPGLPRLDRGSPGARKLLRQP